MPTPTPTRPPTKWRPSVAIALGASVIVGLVVLAFVWPTATASAHDFPVVITGPAAQAQATERALDPGPSHVIDFHPLSNRAAAVASIQKRDTYGAVVLGDPPEILVASANSPGAAAVLRTLTVKLQAQRRAQVAAAGDDAAASTVTVTDVVPLSANDPNGAGLASASFPLVLGGMLGGVLISLLVVGIRRRLTALLVYSAAAGLLVASIMQPVFGILQGPFVVNALALDLSMLGTASLIVGLTALLGPRGIAIGAVITMLIGNPLAGATMPYQFIAGPWGGVGQYFVPGAASSLIRELSYFPGANSSTQWLVLDAWTMAGVLLSVAGHLRSRAGVRSPQPVSNHARRHTSSSRDPVIGR